MSMPSETNTASNDAAYFVSRLGEPELGDPFVEFHEQVAGGLSGPGCGGMRGHAEDVDSPCADLITKNTSSLRRPMVSRWKKSVASRPAAPA